MNKREDIFREIEKERIRQTEKWGEQNHPMVPVDIDVVELRSIYYAIPTERQAKKHCDFRFEKGTGTYGDILVEELCEVIGAETPKGMREELIQLAAVCVQMVEKLDRDARN